MQTFPMLGRDDDLALVRQALDSGTGVVIFGPAGVGKTRLAREALAGLDRRTVYALVATPAAQDIPLATLQDALPGIGGPPEQGIAEARARLAAHRRPPVLFVDDAQWLDAATQTLLHQVTRARQVLVVATVRDDLTVPPTVHDLWKNGHLRRIDLEPLGAADAGRLIESVVGAPVEASTAAELFTRSHGLPFALRELLCEALTRGVLAVRDGRAFATGPLPPSRRLLDVVTGNLDRLPAGPRAVLDAVALAEPLPLGVLRRLFDEPDLHAADEQGVIRVSTSGLAATDPHVVAVGHPLYGEAALAALTPLARRGLLERLVDAACGTSQAMTLRAAGWCLEIGRPVPAADLLEAARLTHRALDPGRAERFAQALWRQRPGAETGLLYATTLSRQQKFETVLEVLDAVNGFQLTEPERVTRAVTANAALVRLARHDEAIAELDAAQPAVRDRAGRARLTATRAFTLSVAGRTRDGLAVVVPLAHSGDPAEFREAVTVAPAMLALDGRADEGLALVERAERLDDAALRDPDGYLRVPPQSLAYQRALCLMYAGRLAEAAECAAAGLRAAGEHGSDYLLAGWLNLLGRVQLDLGRPTSAAHTLGRVVAEAADTSGGAQRALALNALVEAHALLGQVGPARAALDGLLQRPGNVLWYPAGLAELARGQLAFAEGNPPAAVELFIEAHRRAQASNATIALAAAHAVARFGDRRRGWALARELPEIQGPLPALRRAHLRALAGSDLDALLDAAGGLERLGADLFAAEAAGAATALAARRGDTRRTTAARRLGQRLAARVEGAKTPDLVPLSTAPAAGLTHRERQIALLAAGGMTSQAIATALTVSVRTIDNHLLRIYAKLGLTGRRDLSAVLLR